MKIDIRTEDCLYVEINDKIFYIDDSTKYGLEKDLLIYWKKRSNKLFLAILQIIIINLTNNTKGKRWVIIIISKKL
jgi:hypothetical protein